MKRFVLILATLFYCQLAFAEHITGGEMFYTFTVLSNGDIQYHITLKLYRDCFSQGAPLDSEAPIAVFDKATSSIFKKTLAPQDHSETLNLNAPGPCISNAPRVCYQVGYYIWDVVLPPTDKGYTIAYQRCCRINGINNLVSSGSMGATYSADIPGTSRGMTAPKNNSAKFVGVDTVIVCGGYPFTYSFAATDVDGDQLSYSFCDAYVGGGQAQGDGGPNTAQPNPPAPPPYSGVPYSFSFNGFAPLGQLVKIDPATGLITGTAPPEGIYVVTVCVSEIRNGVTIATQRKDLQIKAGGCDIAKAVLDPEYISCDGFTVDFSNRSNSPLINSYYWEFGDPTSTVNNISLSATPSHTFTAAGDYTIKLVTNRNQDCSDSTTAVVRVWPGFFPDFSTSGICVTKPVQFTDGTTTNYGVVDSWSWNFGDENSTADAATTQSSNWTYSGIGPKNVFLTVTNSKGCTKTINKTISVIDKPPITLAFRDTLICVPDALQLQASGTGNFSWTPITSILAGVNTGTPTVNPTSTTVYNVKLDEQGCINNDTVRVRVVNFVTLIPLNDPTTICLTDPVQLNVTSDGLQYQWTPAATLDDATLQNPIATPTATTTYQVTATIGSCSDTKNLTVFAVPYPVANAGNDTTICYNTPAFLVGSHDGSSFTWSPTNSLMNPNTLTPTAYPPRTMEYVLSSFDTRGCPKPGRDTVLVNLLPKIQAYAGHDTLVVVGQPLQLNAEGGVSYIWTPATGLNDANIKSPIAQYDSEVDSIRYTVNVFNEAGCSDSAFVSVVVFKTNPYVFVPTAFTPNGDGLNDVIRPIAVGVERINYFRIFNRWGQLIFSTTTNGAGWDGKIAGVLQGSNVFVWMVNAIDYTGKPIFLKGTTTLIR